MPHSLDASFAAEHATLNGILLAIMGCDELPRMIDGFDSLEPVLTSHIEHEESPTGPLALIERTGLAPDCIARIRADHRLFLGRISDLRHEARGLLTDDFCGDRRDIDAEGMRRRLLDFSDSVLTHEKFETQVHMTIAGRRPSIHVSGLAPKNGLRTIPPSR